MRLYAPFLLALFVGAHAATIPEILQPELEKKIVIEDEKPPVENVPSDPELVDPVNTIVDVENNVRKNSKPEDIPVAVIFEEAEPVVKSAVIEPSYEVVEEEIKRPVVDLRNPGPPQHQEHETQNPEHYEDVERTASSVKEEIQESKVVLRQGLQGVTDGIQNWYTNNEKIINIQNSINSLQESFASQLQKLNETLQNIIKPDSKPLSLEEEKTKTNIETGLESLESKFNAGVKSLTEGVQLVATLKEEGAAETGSSGSASTAAPAGSPNLLQQLANLVGDMQSMMTNGLNNMSQAVNDFVNQNRPNFPAIQNIFQQSTAAPPVYSDTPVEGSSTTPRITAWETLQNSWNNIFNQNQTPQNVQNDQPTQAPGGLFGIQPFPIITNIVNNLIPRPGQTTVKPAVAPQSDPAPAVATPSKPAPEQSNAVPVKPEEIVTKPEPEKAPEPSVNPIRKLIENSVQRIQTANNPDKPRDSAVDAEAVKSEDIKLEAIKVEEVKAEEMKVEDIKPEEIKNEKMKLEEGKKEEVKPEEVKPEVEKVDAEKDDAGQDKGGFHDNRRPGNSDDSSGLDTPSEESQKVSENMEENKETEQVSDKTE